MKKMPKMKKQSHAYKVYASTYSVKSLNSLNPEVQLGDTEYTIRNKLIGLLTKLIGFKFVTTIVLQFKKIENDDETKCTISQNFFSKAETAINESDKGLINIQNIDDNECFKQCLVRYLHLADHHPARTKKVDKDSAKQDIKIPIIIRDIHKIKKRILSLLALLVMKIKKNV